MTAVQAVVVGPYVKVRVRVFWGDSSPTAVDIGGGVTVRPEVGSDEVVQRGSGGRAGPEGVEQRSLTASGRGAEVDAVVVQWA
jgi:hypothetical protein